MSKLLLNFAFATTLYSEKKNYLETFSPFILNALNSTKGLLASDICNNLKAESDLTIPTNTIRSILRALAREKYVKEDSINGGQSIFKLSEKGIKHLEEFTDTEIKIKRKHNEFFSEFDTYLKTNSLNIEFAQIEPKVIDFIQENIHFLTLYDVDGKLNTDFTDGIDDKVILQLMNFIEEIEHHKPSLYETFEELLKGAILWQHIANKEELPEKESAFDPLVVYLDTNIVLSILGLHHPTINEAANQLLAFLKEERKIHVKVLAITLEEIGRLLKSYKNQKENFNSNIGVNSIFSFLKRMGYDDLRTMDLINNLDKKIKEKGINIEKKELLEIDSLNKIEKELYYDLYSFNKEVNDKRKDGEQKEEHALHLSTLHDATIISHVKGERGAWVKSLERSKAILLTESYRLDEFCKKRYKLNDNFPEVILDLTLTNILWLKNPKKNFSLKLHKLIAVHSKKLLVDNGIWRKFTKTLKDQHRSGNLTAQQYAILFSSNQLTVEYLHKVRPEQITLSSLTDLSQKIENEILKDKTAKRVKDSIIKEKNLQIQSIQEEIDEKLIEIEQKEGTIKESATTIEALSAKLKESEDKVQKQGTQLEGFAKQLGDIQIDQKVKDFVNEKMDEYYSPLGRRAIWLLLVCLVALVLIYFSQVADSDDQTKLGMTLGQFKLCKFGAIVIFALIATWIGKAYEKNLWKYIFMRNKLKADMKKTFETEYRNQI
ncbi:hypothetical protein BH11BAC7_BH11BAC7_22200 [soil metagenome]